MDVSFNARPIAVYRPFCNSVEKGLTVYELETRDIDFLTKFSQQVGKNEKMQKENPVYHEIISAALNSIISSLTLRDRLKTGDKSVAYISVFGNRITSIFQGNTPKINLAENSVVYSNRNFPRESEMDWLSVIPTNDGSALPKSGAAAVVAEFFNNCLQKFPKIKSVYCRSELPERCPKSFSFYKKIGLEQIGDRIHLDSPQRPIDLSNFVNPEGFEYSQDEVIPMAIKRNRMKQALSQISQKFAREEVDHPESVDLATVIKSD